jgi:Pyridoxamine 5'-phosphate oxidase
MSATGPAAKTVSDIVEASRYLVLATADAVGRPWSSQLYFAHIGFSEFFWVSSPGLTHSRNIAVRPEVGIVVFDSQAPIGAGQGLYMSAVAELLEGGQTAQGIEAFSRRSAAHGGREWTSPAPAYGSTGPPPPRTGSSPRTAGPITASPYRSPDCSSRGVMPKYLTCIGNPAPATPNAVSLN